MNKKNRYIQAFSDTLVELACIIFVGLLTAIAILLFYYIGNIYGLIVLVISFIILFINNLQVYINHKPDGFPLDYEDYEADET